MTDVFDAVATWVADGRAVALGRIVSVQGSAPRGAGAAMAVNDHHEVAGSVSGGCVESALVDEADGVLASGRPVVAHYAADGDEWSVGLTCGGELDVLVEPASHWPADALPALRAALGAGQAVALATVASADGDPGALVVHPDGTTTGTLGSPGLDARVAEQATTLLADGRELAVLLSPTATVHRQRSGACEVVDAGRPPGPPIGPSAEGLPEAGAAPDVFVQTWVPPDRLLVFGAVDFTAALVTVAKVLGFHVTVCDARPVFATAERFPDADDVVVDRPERLLADLGPTLGPRDAVCVLTHDVKFDVPAIVGALATDVGYLGAMGSRRTHRDRVARLRDAGVTDADLARLHSPIGLDLGARSPGETAVSIMAEVVAHRSGTTGPAVSLRDTDRPIHR